MSTEPERTLVQALIEPGMESGDIRALQDLSWCHHLIKVRDQRRGRCTGPAYTANDGVVFATKVANVILIRETGRPIEMGSP